MLITVVFEGFLASKLKLSALSKYRKLNFQILHHKTIKLAPSKDHRNSSYVSYLPLSRNIHCTGINKITSIDEYFMISHCQGNAKLEYNGGFRAQLGIFTGTKSVK